MTQSDSEFSEIVRRLLEDEKRMQEAIKRHEFERIKAEIMAKKAERVPKKYRGDKIKIKPVAVKKKTARKKAAPRKPASIYPPWPKVE